MTARNGGFIFCLFQKVGWCVFSGRKTETVLKHIFGNKLGINSESGKGEETGAKNPAEILWRKAGREVEGSQGKFRDKKATKNKRNAMKQVRKIRKNNFSESLIQKKSIFPKKDLYFRFLIVWASKKFFKKCLTRYFQMIF